jgi:hypothetical protein
MQKSCPSINLFRCVLTWCVADRHKSQRSQLRNLAMAAVCLCMRAGHPTRHCECSCETVERTTPLSTQRSRESRARVQLFAHMAGYVPYQYGYGPHTQMGAYSVACLEKNNALNECARLTRSNKALEDRALAAEKHVRELQQRLGVHGDSSSTQMLSEIAQLRDEVEQANKRIASASCLPAHVYKALTNIAARHPSLILSTFHVHQVNSHSIHLCTLTRLAS